MVEAFFANPFKKHSIFPIIAFANMSRKNLSYEPGMVSNFYDLNNFALNAQRAFLNERRADLARATILGTQVESAAFQDLPEPKSCSSSAIKPSACC
jgi:hypothetical protein